MFQTLISFIFVFGIIVFAHELGHFATAKWSGIKIHEFSLGMGPAILKKQGKETLYSLRAFPIGGYVKMEGEDEASDDPRSFSNKKPWQRLIILAAGATMNFILAYVLLVIIMFSVGAPSNTIADIVVDMPAAEAGIMADDKIVSIDGKSISSWEQVTSAINQSEGNTLVIEVLRDGQKETFSITPVLKEDGSYAIGIQTKVLKQVDKAFGMAGDQFKYFFTSININ